MSNYTSIPGKYRNSLLIFASLLLAITVQLHSPAHAEETSNRGKKSTDTGIDANKPGKVPEKHAPFTTSITKPSSADLPNFHEVHDYLLRGGEPSRQGLDILKNHGVKTIIDLRAFNEKAKSEKSIAESLGIKYINLPMSSAAPTDKQVSTLLATIDDAKQKKEPVFVHCQHGSDRTGCMIGIWRVQRDGFSFDQAYSEMRKYHFGKKYHELERAVRTRAK